MPALLQACCIRLWYSRRWWDIAKRQFLHFRAVLVDSKVRAVWRSSALKCHFIFVIFMYWMHECTWDLSLTVRWSTSSFSFPLCFDINTCLNYVATLYFPAGQCGVIKLSFGLTENGINFQVAQRIVSQNTFFTTFLRITHFFLQHACYVFYSPGTNLIQKGVSWKCFIVPFSCFSPCQRHCIILKEWIFFPSFAWVIRIKFHERIFTLLCSQF